MAVKQGRPGFAARQWQSAVQRGIDTVSEVHRGGGPEAGGRRRSAWRRLLRKRRWALRLGLFFTVASVFWVGVTAVLASWSTPVWALLITGIIAAGRQRRPPCCCWRYRWLRSEPLPPPVRSAAAGCRRTDPPPVRRWRRWLPPNAGCTRCSGFWSAAGCCRPRRSRELRAAASRTAATMAATAGEVVSMERAATQTPGSHSYLAPTIDAFTAQLNAGVRQYRRMATAAAQLVSSANTGSMSSSPMSQQRYRDELSGATDRLLGWSQAFEELGQLRQA